MICPEHGIDDCQCYVMDVIQELTTMKEQRDKALALLKRGGILLMQASPYMIAENYSWQRSYRKWQGECKALVEGKEHVEGGPSSI